jgi:signal transduction histidine kinase
VSGSGGWRIALLDAAAGTCRSLMLGPLRPVTDALRAGTRPAENGVALDPKNALAEMAKVRHEINNHLTAALAETQLLLMDVTSDELEESYEVIQEQLRKMREAIASTARFTSKA